MKYFLIGYMGCGKSRMGRMMSHDLKMMFVDLDDYIVRREGRSVSEIFAAVGEEGFRQLERCCLEEVCASYTSFVMATGGGTPCFFDNMDYMNRQGKTIFLDADVDTLTSRVLRARDKRPLLSGLDDGEVRDFVEQHLKKRMEYYLKAQEIWEV